MAITSDITTEPPPDRALFIGARLFVAADAFFFLGFLFAYLYLRALNSNGLWHPPHIHPSGLLATVSLVAVVAAAVIVRVADDRRAQVAAAVATVLVLVAAICEGVQLFDPGFSPIHAGGYGAVFVGFTAGFTVHLLGAAYWLETIAADRTTEVGLRLHELRAALVFVTFLAAVAVIATILFYLV
jgi:heme/copper-type cytochrome/quinol oxidase subunit 3